VSSSHFFTRRRLGYGTLVLVVALVAVAVVGIVRYNGSNSSSATTPPAQAAPAAAGANGSLTATITRYQTLLRASPDDYQSWAALGAAYVQQARITVDPSYYPKAEGALQQSLKLDRADNYPAMVGMASLANARHEFATAASWGNQAKQISADDPDIYGTLDDAYTQLGDYPSAGAAVRQMAQLQPGVDSFTRGSYELEEHGDIAGARTLLNQALQTAFTPSDAAFCRYYLGELAYHAGDLTEAAKQYAASLAVDPSYVAALEGKAKTEALQGNSGRAVADFTTVVSRVPQPQYVMEFSEYLGSLGRKAAAATQAQVLSSEEKLFAANGVVDDLTDAEYDVDTGNAAAALAHAQTEWNRRHSVIVADVLGWALHLTGKNAQALQYAKFATKLGWHNALIYYHLGTIETAVGSRSDGARDLGLAHTYNPRFDAATPALSRAQ
jgi:tetratricopeptide (TPR) repeat protein